MSGARLILVEGTPFDWVAAVVAVGLLAALVVMALYRADRRRLGLRIVLSGGAVVSLVLLAWQPRWERAGSSVEAILITPGASTAHVARLADSLQAGAVYALPEATPGELPGQRVAWVPDVGYLARNHPDIRRLHIVGDGLPPYTVDVLTGPHVVVHGAPPAPGITFVDYPQRVVLGQALQVQGRVYLKEATATTSHTLYLDGPGGHVDSAGLSGAGFTAFSLETTPRQAGLFQYRLGVVSARGDTVAVESLGVAVREPTPLRVLVLQGAPTFETRYLKNWMAAQGGRIAVRSTVSRDRYQTEYVNQPEQDLTRLTSSILDGFDVVMLDGRVLDALSPAEQRLLWGAVHEEGLGMLLDAGRDAVNAGKNRADGLPSFDLEPLDEEPRRVRLVWDDSVRTSAVPVAPAAIDGAWGVEPVIQDEGGRWVAAFQPFGVGRVGVTLVRETFRWVLEGETGMHAAYWSRLLTLLSRVDAYADNWSVGVGHPFLRDEPIRLTLQTIDSAPRGVVYAGVPVPDTVYLAQHPVEPTRWQGTFWPREVGWHRVMRVGEAIDSRDAFSFYVHGAGAWQGVRATEKRLATKLFAEKSSPTSVLEERSGPVARVPVSSLWFFVPFVACCAGLWIESKM